MTIKEKLAYENQKRCIVLRLFDIDLELMQLVDNYLDGFISEEAIKSKISIIKEDVGEFEKKDGDFRERLLESNVGELSDSMNKVATLRYLEAALDLMKFKKKCESSMEKYNKKKCDILAQEKVAEYKVSGREKEDLIKKSREFFWLKKKYKKSMQEHNDLVDQQFENNEEIAECAKKLKAANISIKQLRNGRFMPENPEMKKLAEIYLGRLRKNVAISRRITILKNEYTKLAEKIANKENAFNEAVNNYERVDKADIQFDYDAQKKYCENLYKQEDVLNRRFLRDSYEKTAMSRNLKKASVDNDKKVQKYFQTKRSIYLNFFRKVNELIQRETHGGSGNFNRCITQLREISQSNENYRLSPTGIQRTKGVLINYIVNSVIFHRGRIRELCNGENLTNLADNLKAIKKTNEGKERARIVGEALALLKSENGHYPLADCRENAVRAFENSDEYRSSAEEKLAKELPIKAYETKSILSNVRNDNYKPMLYENQMNEIDIGCI